MSNPDSQFFDLNTAHDFCSLNRASIENSTVCGCFHCEAIFAPSEVVDWINDASVRRGLTGETAICPRCGIDSVIGSESGFPITAEFLEKMHARWFL